MPVVKKRDVLSGMRVAEAMRRQIVAIKGHMSIKNSIHKLVKYKSNILLVIDKDRRAKGIVSKTDIMGAFYAGIPIETPIEDIMAGPISFCYVDDKIETALELMNDHSIHQIFVRGSDPDFFDGLISYGDIVGKVYRFCSRCQNNIHLKQDAAMDSDSLNDAVVADMMATEVVSCLPHDSLYQVIEILSAMKLGAVLVIDKEYKPLGIISKTDTIVAWNHDVSPEERADKVMSSPVRSISSIEKISDAVRKMLFQDLSRLIVYKDHPDNITGILTLSDTAKARSGACRACMSTRIVIPS